MMRLTWRRLLHFSVLAGSMTACFPAAVTEDCLSDPDCPTTAPRCTAGRCQALPDGAAPENDASPAPDARVIDHGPTPDSLVVVDVARPAVDARAADLGPDSDPTPADAGLPDAVEAPLDEGRVGDARVPDAAVPDAALPDAALPDMASAPPTCPPIEPGEPALGPVGGRVEVGTLALGGPLLADELMLVHLDGRDEGPPDVLALRGGALQAARPDGSLRWRTPPLDLIHIESLTDLTGDGRPEIIARTDHLAFVLDALSGVVRWVSDPTAVNPLRAHQGIYNVLVLDVNRDGVDDLYFTEGGCGSNDDFGDGVLFDFSVAQTNAQGRFDGVVRVASLASRADCPYYHAFGDLDGDGALEFLAAGVSAYEAYVPSTGAAHFCPLALNGLSDDTGAAIVADLETDGRDDVVIRDRTNLHRIGAEPDAECVGGARMVLRWTQVLPGGSGQTEPTPVLVPDVDGDGTQEIVVSSSVAGAWATTVHSGATGAQLARLDGQVLVGRLRGDGAEGPNLLTQLTAETVPPALGTLTAQRIIGGGFVEAWRLDDVGAAMQRIDARRKPEQSRRRREVAQRADAGVYLWHRTPGTTTLDALRLVAPDGSAVSEVPASGEFGTIALESRSPADACSPDATPDACPAPLLAVVDSEGEVALRDGRTLELLNAGPDGAPALRAPGGTPQLLTVPGGGHDGEALVAAMTMDGRLVGFQLERSEPVERWTRRMGRDMRRLTVPPPAPQWVPAGDGGGPALLVRSYLDSTAFAWTILEADTGETRWVDLLPATDVTATPDAAVLETLAGHTRVLRLDSLANNATPPLRTCGFEQVSPAAPPNCPSGVQTWTLTSLDALTGDCEWRLALAPSNCRGNGSERIGIVPARDGAEARVFVTLVEQVFEVDATTGSVVQFTPATPGGVAFGGRVISLPGGPGLLRMSGTAPPRGLNEDLSLAWTCNGCGPTLRQWRDRDVVVLGDRLLTTAGTEPLYQIDAPTGFVTAQFAFRDGAATPVDDTTQTSVERLVRIDDLLMDRSPGVLLSGTDTWLYGLSEAGEVVFSTLLGTRVGQAAALPRGPDSPALAIPTGDALATFFDRPTLAAPQAVWEVPCPVHGLSCDVNDDIDETLDRTRLCAAWQTSDDVYDVRVVGPNGVPVTAWNDLQSPVSLDGLDLLPGAIYHFEVRGWRILPDRGLVFSEIVRSDGITLVDDSPPTVELSLSGLEADGIAHIGQVLQLQMNAQDDDGLAAWQLDVYRDVGAAPVHRIGAHALAHQSWRGGRTFDPWHPGAPGDVRCRAPVPGLYTVVARVQDRAGQWGEARQTYTAADEPCPGL